MITKKIIIILTIISSTIHTQYALQIPQNLPMAAKLIELMNQTIQLDTNLNSSNQISTNQHNALWQHATTTINHLRTQYSPQQQKQDIINIQIMALKENKIRELFTVLLNEYLSIFGQMYQKTSTIFYGYTKYLILTSQSDKNQAITPELYPQLLETIKLAEKQSDWAINVRIDLPVILESNIAMMQPCTLATIIKALEQMPPTSAYYNTAKNIALGVAAVGATAALAYGVYTYGDQLKAFIPGTTNTTPAGSDLSENSKSSTSNTIQSDPQQISIENNNEKTKQLSAMDVLAAGNKKLDNPVITSMLAHNKKNSVSEQQKSLSTANNQFDIHPTVQNYVAKQAELKNNPSQKTGILESQPITQPQAKSPQDLQQTILQDAHNGNASAKMILINQKNKWEHSDREKQYLKNLTTQST
ncbi:MAG: hypothetical protein ACXWL5_04615 [Candidatus Chromulinivorax sp.]